LLFRLAAARNSEAVVLRVQNDHVPMPRAVRLGVDAEAVLEQDAAARQPARVELLLAVVVLQPSWTGRGLGAHDEELLLRRLTNTTNS